MTTNKLLTAAEMTAKLARGAAARTRRAEARARIATEMGRSICDREVLREMGAQLRNGRR